MPTIVAIAGYTVGGVLILYGVICMFIPLKKIWEAIIGIRIRNPIISANRRVKRIHKGFTLAVSDSKFNIIWISEKFYLKDTNGKLHSYNGTDEEGKSSLVLEAQIRVDTFRTLTIQSIALEISKREFPWNENDEDVFVYGESTIDSFQFELPLSIPRGKQIVSIKAIVEGVEYRLPNQSIIHLPRKNNVDRQR